MVNYKKIKKFIIWHLCAKTSPCISNLQQNYNNLIQNLGKSMVQCKTFMENLEVHKVSKVVTHKIAPISNSSKYHLYLI
jgi:hypothetical protein